MCQQAQEIEMSEQYLKLRTSDFYLLFQDLSYLEVIEATPVLNFPSFDGEKNGE